MHVFCFTCAYEEVGYNYKKLVVLYDEHRRMRPGHEVGIFEKDPENIHDEEGAHYYKLVCLHCERGLRNWTRYSRVGVNKTIAIHKQKEPTHTVNVSVLEKEEYRTRKEERELKFDRQLEEVGITRSDLSHEKHVETGNEEVAFYISQGDKSKFREIFIATQLDNNLCPYAHCPYKFEIQEEVFLGYDALLNKQYHKKTEEEIAKERKTTKFHNILNHFRENHMWILISGVEEERNAEGAFVNRAYGLLQECVMYETAYKMLVDKKRESGRNRDRNRDGDKQLGYTKRQRQKMYIAIHNLFKKFGIPQVLIRRLFGLSSEYHVGISGYKGMLASEEVPQWLVKVVENI